MGDDGDNRPGRLVLVAVALFTVGEGATLPYLLVYLHLSQHLSVVSATATVSLVTAVAIPAALGVGVVADLCGIRRVAFGAAAVFFAGATTLAVARTVALTLAGAVAFGVGTGIELAVFTTAVATVSPNENRFRSFGLRYAVQNLGQAAGAGLAVGALTLGLSYRSLYLFNACACVAATIVLLAALPSMSAGRAYGGTGYKDLLAADRSFRRVSLWVIAASAIGFGQLTAALPAFAITVLRVPPTTLGWAFAANTATVAAFQLVGIKMVRVRLGIVRALSATAVCWAGAWMVLAGGRWIQPLAGRQMCTVGCLIVFAFGEVFWAPVAPTVFNDLATDAERGRCNALFGACCQTGLFIGPALTAAVLLLLSPELLPLVLVGAATVLAVATGPTLRLEDPMRAQPEISPPG